ncbi:Ferrienterobactin-binding periplasmic protein precursor [Jeotgalicoccus aerolatus]|uniref:Iron complex transport system substrate-binding protein n=1 Tax=Jeotgalicoccus aerolatus TaxID=709510 RepID=A0ABS4HP88_9STAP|nr:ABC transporter substrate-binding protein [Jeotgalicoccus aerolatus]MBP1952745.1 iron complex transport system substrate-binding protein [Jeotgalicoccus aerolatus]GGE08509.1 ferrichrome ABC transporter substrate-binding protein [Jeotgalicoccus aerolatus]CAD2080878.1 Ferrienterobactin-binding periplasmic protein precursor [Jeotgalicoccus aerolatus]
MKKLLGLMLGMSLIAAGCSNEAEDTANNTDTEEVAVTDDAGHEVSVPENPERIIGTYLEDDLLTLEETPVVQWTVGEESIQEYLQPEGLEGVPLMPFDLPFEAVTLEEPDLLLLSSSDLADGDKYDSYSKIAPTFVVESGSYDDWRDRLTRVSEVFGKEDLAEEKINEYNSVVENTAADLEEEVGDESAVAVWWTGDSYFISNQDKSSGEVLYNDLGLTAPPLVEELSADNETPWIEASLESLAELEADHIFFIGTDEGDSEAAFSDDVFSNIPAIENGNVYEYTKADSWLYSGYIANSLIVEDVEEALVSN